MSKKARLNLPDKEKHARMYSVAKKVGRSSGPLRMGLTGVMVTPKIYKAQLLHRNKAREKQGLAPLEES
jgi:hypothetical protein|tara:strand:- start:1228 stop:1434 length:207 start_codon:yes stop_codon:yes gene_type:complete